MKKSNRVNGFYLICSIFLIFYFEKSHSQEKKINKSYCATYLYKEKLSWKNIADELGLDSVIYKYPFNECLLHFSNWISLEKNLDPIRYFDKYRNKKKLSHLEIKGIISYHTRAEKFISGSFGNLIISNFFRRKEVVSLLTRK